MLSLRAKVVLVYVGLAALSAGAITAECLGATTAAVGILAAQILYAGVFMHWVNYGTYRRLKKLKQQVEAGGAVEVDDECADLGRAIGKAFEARREDVHLRDAQLAVVLEAESRARLAAQTVLDESPHGIALVSPTGRVELVNSRAMRFGWEKDQMVEHVPHAWMRDLVARALQTRQKTALEGKCGKSGRIGMVQVFEEGRELFFQPQAHPVMDAKGTLTGVVIILADVTEMLRGEEAPRNLLSSFSHEIRTPMTSLQMSIYLLLDDAASRLTPRQLELLQAARDDADRLHRIVEEALGRRKSAEENAKGS